MNEIISQLSNLKIAKFEIVLQSQSEAVLPALIGGALRGAFGHALKAISCCVPHKNCEICFLSDACLYTTVFEPISAQNQDMPRPFIFSPPIPPLTREISESSKLKLRIANNGKISFGLTLVGETIKKLPYFVYAIELLARHGLGVERQSFSLAEVFLVNPNTEKISIYSPEFQRVQLFETPSLFDFVSHQNGKLKINDSLKIRLQTPLRIRRSKVLVEKITFPVFFKQCSLRLKFLFEQYGKPLDYDYQTLNGLAENITVKNEQLWRHDFTRRTNRQDKKLDLDGMLGEIEFQGDFAGVLPIIIACECLHIGSASSLGLGKFEILDYLG